MQEKFYTNFGGITAIPSAAYTTTQTSADIQTYNARCVTAILDTTVFGSGSVTLTINGKDPVSGKYYLLLSGAAVVSVVTNKYTVGPGLAVTTNVSANAPLPEFIQLVATANNANSQTYSVGVNFSV